MVLRNTSDSIEDYINQLLLESEVAELKRSQLADLFQVVPSQINYVIKTRFTESRGYIVESKRGGGGYIRISKVAFSDNHHLLSQILTNLGQTVSSLVFVDIIQLLFEEGLISDREGNLLIGSASDEVLGGDAPTIRSRILRHLLQGLDLGRF